LILASWHRIKKKRAQNTSVLPYGKYQIHQIQTLGKQVLTLSFVCTVPNIQHLKDFQSKLITKGVAEQAERIYFSSKSTVRVLFHSLFKGIYVTLLLKHGRVKSFKHNCCKKRGVLSQYEQCLL